MKANELNETAAKLDSLQIQAKRKQIENQRLDQMIQDVHQKIG